MPGIPRIIHQTYKRRDDEKLGPLMDSWEGLNAPDGWEHRFYDDDACDRFVRTEYPQFYETYTTLKRGAQRADMFRYLVVYHFGGVYADADTECLVPLNQWQGVDWDTAHSVLEREFRGSEPPFVLRMIGGLEGGDQLLQFFFAFEAKSPQLLAMVQRLDEDRKAGFPGRGDPATWKDVDVLATTGPWLFTRVLREASPVQPYFQARTFQGTTFRHVCFGSWREGSSSAMLRKQLVIASMATAVLALGLLARNTDRRLVLGAFGVSLLLTTLGTSGVV